MVQKISTAGLRAAAIAAAFFAALGCATTAPRSEPVLTQGIASWYGQEFAGRTTANGEIFDPALLTAAHRTLPFGTIVDVKSAKTGSRVRVRINDRGPFIGGRIIDLSYAAAQRIGLIEPGLGQVEIAIIKLGLGDREPPAPIVVAIGSPDAVAPSTAPAAVPEVAFPIPGTPVTATTSSDFTVQVEEERAGTPTRRRVAADGRTIEAVPLAAGGSASAPFSASTPPTTSSAPVTAAVPNVERKTVFVVQAGAFALEANARQLQQQIERHGYRAHIDHSGLYRVRLGPFALREDAVRARAQLEASGLSAIVTTTTN